MRLRRSLAIVGVGALATAAPLTASALANGGGTHTVHFTAVKVMTANFKAGGAEFDKDVHGGKVTSYTISDFTSQKGADVVVALNHGFLYGHYTFAPQTGTVTGKVTGGSGKYKGATGSISGHAISNTRTKVTVTYHQ